MRPGVRNVFRLVVSLMLAVGLTIGLAGSAAAHDVLISSRPAAGSTVRTAPTSITFTFDQPVQNFDPVVSLVGPDGRQYAVGPPSINGDVVTGTVTAGPDGDYTAGYRIVSADGHPVTGAVHFTLATGAPTPGPAVSSAPGAAGAGSGSAAAGAAASTTKPALVAPAGRATAGGLSVGIWIGLILASLIIAAAGLVLFRRPGGRPGGINRPGAGDQGGSG